MISQLLCTFRHTMYIVANGLACRGSCSHAVARWRSVAHCIRRHSTPVIIVDAGDQSYLYLVLTLSGRVHILVRTLPGLVNCV